MVAQVMGVQTNEPYNDYAGGTVLYLNHRAARVDGIACMSLHIGKNDAIVIPDGVAVGTLLNLDYAPNRQGKAVLCGISVAQGAKPLQPNPK